MNRVVTCFLIASIIALSAGQPLLGSDKHNYFNCPRPDEAKTLLLDQPLKIEGKLLRVQKRTLLFPDNDINTKRITCIMVTDMDVDDNGGFVEVVDGGIGNYDVTFHFTTQFGKGLHFRIRIYGTQ